MLMTKIKVDKVVAMLIALVLTFANPLAVMAQSGGNCSVFRSWS